MVSWCFWLFLVVFWFVYLVDLFCAGVAEW